MSLGGWRLHPQQVGLGTAEAHALANAEPKRVPVLGAEYRARLVEGAVWNPRCVAFAPTGGQRITPDEAEALRRDLLALVVPFGGLARGPANDDDKRAFDAHLAQWLGLHLKVAPVEAAQGGMWAWLGCAVAPELVRWRWAADKVDPKRFSASRVRNLFASRWWRWRLLWDEDQPRRPAWLLVGLGEDELVQLTERAYLATNGPLVRAFAGAFLAAAEADRGLRRMEVLREATKRLLRLNGILALDALEPDELRVTVEAILAETLAAMGDRGRRSRPPVVPSGGGDRVELSPQLVRYGVPELPQAEPPASPEVPLEATDPVGRSALPDDTPRSLAERLLAGGALGNQAVRELTGWTEGEAREWLQAGVEEGWLLKSGEKRGTRYQLVDGLASSTVDEHLDLPSRLDHVLDSPDGATLPGAPFSTQQREVILLGLERHATLVADLSATERRAVRHAFPTNAAYEEIIKLIRPLLDLA